MVCTTTPSSIKRNTSCVHSTTERKIHSISSPLHQIQSIACFYKWNVFVLFCSGCELRPSCLLGKCSTTVLCFLSPENKVLLETFTLIHLSLTADFRLYPQRTSGSPSLKYFLCGLQKSFANSLFSLSQFLCYHSNRFYQTH